MSHLAERLSKQQSTNKQSFTCNPDAARFQRDTHIDTDITLKPYSGLVATLVNQIICGQCDYNTAMHVFNTARKLS